MTPAPGQAPGQRADSLARDLWRTGTWRLMPLLLLYIIGVLLYFTALQSLAASEDSTSLQRKGLDLWLDYTELCACP